MPQETLGTSGGILGCHHGGYGQHLVEREARMLLGNAPSTGQPASNKVQTRTSTGPGLRKRVVKECFDFH